MGAGRQREFDEKLALEAAMNVFWLNGYSGTSLSELTAAMGINKPSLYAAFGNKEALFVQSLQHYVEQHGNPHTRALHDPGASLQSRLRAYLKSIVQMLTDPSLPGGCFVAATTNEGGGACLPSAACEAIATINQQTRQALGDFFRQEILAGNVDNDVSEETLAGYILTLQNGLAVMARSGVDDATLDMIAEFAVQNF